MACKALEEKKKRRAELFKGENNHKKHWGL
jgi:hypothetical protein